MIMSDIIADIVYTDIISDIILDIPMSPRMVWFLRWIWKLQGCHGARRQKKYQPSSEHHKRLAGLDTPVRTQRRCQQRRSAAAAQESAMKTLSRNGRLGTFPLEVAVAHSVDLQKQCVQESRALPPCSACVRSP